MGIGGERDIEVIMMLRSHEREGGRKGGQEHCTGGGRE